MTFISKNLLVYRIDGIVIKHVVMFSAYITNYKLTSLARFGASVGVFGFTGVTGRPVFAADASNSKNSERDFLLIPK